MSKADRGFLLAETGLVDPAPAPRPARKVKLQRHTAAGAALQDILRECAGQIIANIEAVVALDVPEGPHQLRIGLRRLRSALALFRTVASCELAGRLKTEARWLALEAGHLRDLQVIVAEIVPEHAGNAFKPSWVRAADRGCRQSGGRCPCQVAPDARGNSCPGLPDRPDAFHRMPGPGRFRNLPAQRGWRAERRLACLPRRPWATGGARSARLPGGSTSCRWRASYAAQGTEETAIRDRILRPLFPGRRVKPFLASLRLLQDLFGELSDAAMLETRIAELANDTGRRTLMSGSRPVS